MTDANLFTDVTEEASAESNGKAEPEPSLFGAEETRPKPPPEERKPERHEPRTPAADLITMIWGGFGMALVQSQADIPVGRVLQFQAPLAGKQFDALIAGTWLDQVIQPFVKQAEKVEGFGALITFPLLVAAMERQPSLAPALSPMLRQVVHTSLIDMAPVMKKRASDEKKAMASLKDMNDALGIGKDDDPVEAIINAIFAPPEGWTEPEEATE